MYSQTKIECFYIYRINQRNFYFEAGVTSVFTVVDCSSVGSSNTLSLSRLGMTFKYTPDMDPYNSAINGNLSSTRSRNSVNQPKQMDEPLSVQK